jgi:hypothetical protein
MLTYGVLRRDTERARSAASVEEAFVLVAGLPAGVEYIVFEIDGLQHRELYSGLAAGPHPLAS